MLRREDVRLLIVAAVFLALLVVWAFRDFPDPSVWTPEPIPDWP
jgi:hypothetical protein